MMIMSVEYLISEAKRLSKYIDINGYNDYEIYFTIKAIDNKVADFLDMIQRESIYIDIFDDMTVYSLENVKIGLIYE